MSVKVLLLLCLTSLCLGRPNPAPQNDYDYGVPLQAVVGKKQFVNRDNFIRKIYFQLYHLSNHQESQQRRTKSSPTMLEDTSTIPQETLTVRTIAKQDVDTIDIASQLAVIIVIMTPLKIFHLFK